MRKAGWFKPVLAPVFVCSELDIGAVDQGVVQILADCPIIGASTAGEIANNLVMNGVVVTLILSPHLRARVGMGRGASKDYRKAVNEAQAYRHLQKISMDKNRPMMEVAEAIILMIG